MNRKHDDKWLDLYKRWASECHTWVTLCRDNLTRGWIKDDTSLVSGVNWGIEKVPEGSEWRFAARCLPRLPRGPKLALWSKVDHFVHNLGSKRIQAAWHTIHWSSNQRHCSPWSFSECSPEFWPSLGRFDGDPAPDQFEHWLLKVALEIPKIPMVLFGS